MAYLKQSGPWLYDNASGDIVGFKDDDGSEVYFARAATYGSFYDIADQTADEDEATVIDLGETDIANGISIADGSKITVTRTGTYNLQFSAQLANDGGQEQNVSFWLAKQGSSIAATNSDVTVPKSHAGGDGHAVAAWNWFVQLNAGQYVELMWSTPSTNITIEHKDAQASPTRPVTPSVIVTITEVSQA